MHFVVKDKCLRASCELHTGVEFAHRVFRVSNGFDGLADIDGTCGEHFDVDESEHFALHKVGVEFGAVAVTGVRVFIDADVGLDHSFDLCPHVGGAPDAADVLERHGVSADDAAFFDGAGAPGVEVPSTEVFHRAAGGFGLVHELSAIGQCLRRLVNTCCEAAGHQKMKCSHCV